MRGICIRVYSDFGSCFSWAGRTFGLFLWLAAVLAGVVLHRSFQRDGVDTDALNVVCLVVLAGVLGAKTWHELQDPALLRETMKNIFFTRHEPFRAYSAGAWRLDAQRDRSGSGLAGRNRDAAVAGQALPKNRTAWTGLRGGVRMLDLAAAAAPVGYGIGRLGCLTSGDGDYGRITTSKFWGVHIAPNALVPVHPPDALVLNTPLWELLAALLIAWVIWRLGAKARPLGWLTAMYLVLSGLARFTVEFWRINPKLYLGDHFSNAQMAALGSVLAGSLILLAVRGREQVGGPGGDAGAAGGVGGMMRVAIVLALAFGTAFAAPKKTVTVAADGSGKLQGRTVSSRRRARRQCGDPDQARSLQAALAHHRTGHGIARVGREARKT